MASTKRPQSSFYSLIYVLKKGTFVKVRSSDMTTEKKTILLGELDDVQQRLATLGLTASSLAESLQHGLRNRLQVSALVPATYPGINQWAHTVEGLRVNITPQGWTYQAERNMPLFFHDDENICFTTYSGTKETGTKNEPTNKSPKGEKTQEICLINNPQHDLFPETIQLLEKWKSGSIPTWILLYHLDTSNPDSPVLRAEFSKPSKFEKKHITEWSERLILEPIEIGESIVIDNEEELPALDIPVMRKTP